MTARAACAVLVAYAFPPLNVIGAQRALRIARVLLDRYERVYVAGLDTAALDPDQLDFEVGRDVLENPRLVYLAARPLLDRVEFRRDKSTVQRVINAVLSRLFCGNAADWVPGLKRALARIPAGEAVDLVIATGTPFATFPSAVAWARRRAAPSILDYRDLWTRNPRAPYPAAARWLVRTLVERRVNRAASMLTTVSRGCREMLGLDAAGTPVRLLLNSPDDAYLKYYGNIVQRMARAKSADGQEMGHRRLRVVFTGQVYPECTFEPFLRALSQVPVNLRERLEVHYYGGCSLQVAKDFERFGAAALLRDHGFVSKEESIEAILGADLLLSLIHTDSVASDPAVTGLMTTKLYDYFLSGKPILNIGPADAEVNVFAGELGYTPFHSFPARETDALRRFVEGFASGRVLQRLEPLAVVMPDFAQTLHAILDTAVEVRAAGEPRAIRAPSVE